MPLALHGASGLGVDMLERAVALGIRKVNFNAELRASYFAATLGTVEHATVGSDLLQLHTVQRDAVAKTVAAKLDGAGQGGRPPIRCMSSPGLERRQRAPGTADVQVAAGAQTRSAIWSIWVSSFSIGP